MFCKVVDFRESKRKGEGHCTVGLRTGKACCIAGTNFTASLWFVPSLTRGERAPLIKEQRKS